MQHTANAKILARIVMGLLVAAASLGLLWIWSDPALAQVFRCTVNPPRLNVRARPSTSARIVGQMVSGTIFEVTARTATAEWLWGKSAAVQGWASSQHLRCPFDEYDLTINEQLVSTGALSQVTNTPIAPPTSTPIAPPTPQPLPTLTATWTPIAPPMATATPTPSRAPSGAETSEIAAGPVWVSISAGGFVMGSSEEDIWEAVDSCNVWESNCEFSWFDSELPQKTVWLDAYDITQYEITNEQYVACADAGVCRPTGEQLGDKNIALDPRFARATYPVVGVSWYDADSYCAWIGGRLPSEEEWEKAARGVDGRSYPWGSTFDTSRANLFSDSPAPVGSYSAGASPYGVEDMAGNAFEWTNSSVDGRYVLRGGSWYTYPYRARTADRGTKLVPSAANHDIGFRCVR